MSGHIDNIDSIFCARKSVSVTSQRRSASIHIDDIDSVFCAQQSVSVTSQRRSACVAKVINAS